MDFKRVERIVEHVGVGDRPDGRLVELEGGWGSETGGWETRHAHAGQATAGGYPIGRGALAERPVRNRSGNVEQETAGERMQRHAEPSRADRAQAGPSLARVSRARSGW